MGQQDPRVDTYIENSAEFAKPILVKLRDLVHRACPEVTETIKWGMPSFEYKGPFCGMAAFKHHAVFGFWKAALLFADEKAASGDEKKMTWGAPGRVPIPAKITGISDLPADTKILALVKRAKKLNDQGIKVSKEIMRKTPIPIPADFQKMLSKNKVARELFQKFSQSQQREYLQWIVDAKRDVTRQKRLATAIEWISEGKQRNWKYQK